METAGGSVLRVENLTKSFPLGFFRRKFILKGISFEIFAQGATGFVGVNGSGKTTTLKCLLEFIFPDSGEVSFFGSDPRKGLGRGGLKERLGYLPERPYFYEFLNTLEFLKFHWDLGGGGSGFSGAAQEVLNQVNLKGVEKTPLRSFSKGMLQRIGIAQALLRRPDFLILDEPMSGLDPDGRYLIKEIIREEKKRGTTIFFSSHLLSDVEELCENLVILDQGKILYTGSTQGFIDQSPLGLEGVFYRKLREFSGSVREAS